MENSTVTKRLPVSGTNITACLTPLVFLGVLILIALIFTPANSISSASRADDMDVPISIRDLITEIQGKSPDEVTSIIHKRFGPGHDIGSGFRIELWDIDGGVLCYSPPNSPTYKKAGKAIWLLKTTNYLGANLNSSFEMTSLPTKQNHNEYWMGDLKLRPNKTYQFKFPDDDKEPSHTGNPDVDKSWRVNFLRLYTKGKVSVRYADQMTSKTLLENVPDRAKVAEITLTSMDGRQKESFDVVNWTTARMLFLINVRIPGFQIWKAWDNNWP